MSDSEISLKSVASSVVNADVKKGFRALKGKLKRPVVVSEHPPAPF